MSSPVLYLEGWYVEPEYQGKGVGRALMNSAFEWGKSRGCKEAASDARPENARSIKAHASLGFEEAGILIHFRRSID